MYRKLKPFIALCAFTLAFGACSSSSSARSDGEIVALPVDSLAPLVTREVSVGSFSSLYVGHSICVEFTEKQDGAPEVTVFAPENCIDHLKTEVRNGQLRVYYDFKGSKYRTNGTVVQVSAPALQRVEAATVGKFVVMGEMHVRGNLDVTLNTAAHFAWDNTLRVDGQLRVDGSSAAKIAGKGLEAKNLQLTLSSAAKATLSGVKTEGLEAVASSAANLSLEGETGTARLVASSGALLKAGALTAGSTEADGSSGAKIEAPRTKELTYSQSSGGKVSWKGRPHVTRR